MKEMFHVLVVEDQEGPLRLILSALAQDSRVLVDTARWYTQAEKFVRSGCPYDLILLDHRMPYEAPPCTEREDFNRFCDSLQNIGYGLMALIRKHLPQTLVVGTSSLSSEEIREGGYSAPERVISKIDAFNELPPILAEF